MSEVIYVTSILSFLKDLFTPPQQGRVLLVGGSVRDMLLGKECRDLDLVVALSAGELVLLGFRLVEATSGATIYFKQHPGFGKIEATCIDSMDHLADDLRRRDFTVNAIAMDLSGAIVDPLGGEGDVRHRLLRACSDHSFTDDPLRIFRAFRFEADGWSMNPETETLIQRREWKEAFRSIPTERFTLEMLKALTGTAPERFFQRMIEFNAGAEFLPELFRMPQIPAGPLQHHPEGDLFSHSVQVLQRVATMSDCRMARFCAFFHDIGKLATDPDLYPKHHGHDTAGFGLAVDFCSRLGLSSGHRKALAWISTLHGKANLWDQLRDSSKIRMAEQAIKADIAGILPLVSAADKPGGAPMTGWDHAVRVAGMNTRELGIDQEKLEAMPVSTRPSYIMQKRIEVLRS